MLRANNQVGLVFFPAFDWAISPTHPEREERLLYTQDQVFEEGLFDLEGIQEFKPDPVSIRDVQRVHFCVPDEWSVMTESHFISAGGAKTIAMAVMDKQIDKGFALVRPPGHHAMRVVHGARGFCNINIEAVMIEFIRQAYKVRKVAIVDTDCHHGDGTQDIYWHDPDTLFISLHQDGRTLYPGTGFVGETGGPNAIGATINIPLPPHTSEEGFLYAAEHAVLPILQAFEPEIIVNSAGQDNHFSDPITNMNFSARGYADLTAMLKPDIAVLEGGYAIEGALPYVNVGIILAMAGIDYTKVTEPGYDPQSIRQGPEITRWITKICDTVMRNWEKRQQSQAALQHQREFDRRSRNIYYDTDNISETQQETVRICRECGGAYKIESGSNRGFQVRAVHIPRNACPRCRQQGYDWYASADRRQVDMALLQDRSQDQYLKNDFSS